MTRKPFTTTWIRELAVLGFLSLGLTLLTVSCSKQGQTLLQKNKLITTMAADPDVRAFIAASNLQTNLILSPLKQSMPTQSELESNGMPEYKKLSQAEIEAKVHKVIADNLEQTQKVMAMGAQIALKYKLSSYSPEQQQEIVKQVWTLIDSGSLKKDPKRAKSLN